MSTSTKNKWSFQDEIVDILIQMDVEQGNFSTIVDMPTGTGKTRTAFKFIDAMVGKNKNKVKFLWLCDRIQLLSQTVEAYKELVEKGIIKDIGNSQLINSSAEGLEDIKPDTDILYASPRSLSKVADKKYESFQEWLKCDKLYIIYDEAHHIGASSADKVFSSIFGVNIAGVDVNCKYNIESYGLIGLTATVYREDVYIDRFNYWFKDGYENGKPIHDSSPLGKDTEKEVASNRIVVRSIREQINAGVIIEPEFRRKDDMRKAMDDGAADDKLADILVNDIADNHREYGKTIIFVKNINFAETVVEKLEKKKIEAFEFTSRKTDEEKKKDFASEDNKSGIMVTVDKASEGFDVRNVKTVYLAVGIKSQVLIRQRVGRVIRSAKDKSKAMVVWQDYGTGYLNPQETFDKALSPASRGRAYYESWYHFLNVMELFSADAIEKSESIGYFDLFEDRVPIYVLEKERKGYFQYYYMIQSDYIRLKGFNSFSDYAEKMGLSEDELCEEIKRICFTTNIGRINISYKPKKGQMKVNDKQLMDFCVAVIADDDLVMPKYHLLKSKDASVSSDDSYSEDDNNDINRMCQIYKKHIEERREGKRAENFEEAVTLLSSVQREIRAINRPKEYSKNMVLLNGKEKYLNSELESIRYLLRLGCLWGRKGDEYLSAYLGESKNGDEMEVIGKSRRYADNEPDKMMIAYALVTRINNIRVTEEIVDEYIQSISLAFHVDEEKAIHYMSALGYSDNDSIIRRQCRNCKEVEKLPELLKFVIYEKAYEQLYTELKYTDEDAYPLFECKNTNEVEEEYKEILDLYGVSEEDMKPLTVIEDLIYDYRPYIKAIKNYQGIKPEFLTRLTSNIFNMGKDYSVVVDAFGGSAASTLNYLGRNNIELKFNDFGWLNTTFYRVIADKNKRDKLCKMVDSYCKDILAGKDITIRGIKCQNDVFNKSTDDIYNEYISKVGSDAAEKIEGIEDNYRQKLQSVSEPKAIDNTDFRKIEKSLYALITKVQVMFKISNVDKGVAKKELKGINDISAAFIFLMYQNFSDRHFFNGCTIQLLGEFYATYERVLEIVGEYIKNKGVEIKCGDALEMMGDSKYNYAGVNWYLDIPYSATDTSTYSGCIDENDFMARIKDLKGNYAVSSRFNICVKDAFKESSPKSYIESIKLAENNDKFKARKNIIYEFYTRFTTEEDSKEFDYEVFKEKPKRCYLSSEKQAKYIFIPFVQASDVYAQSTDDNEKKDNNRKFRANLLTDDGLKRMLASTLYSNIPIEIIITDVEIDEEKCKTIYWQDNDNGIGVIPTFKMGVNNYNNDASVFVMRYDLFINELRDLLYKQVYIEQEARKSAEKLRNYYNL